MKKIQLILLYLCVINFFLSCSPKSAEDKEPSKKDRNMFGHYIPRGLTKTSQDLTPGFVMFRGANSSYAYLINREGQVVHQWRGQYAVLNSYLMNDGAIIAQEFDPDYPVFLGDGVYGRLQKISWDGKILWDFEYTSEEFIIHHDVALLPNGNLLAIAYEVISFEEAVALGRKPHLTPVNSGGFLEKIIEIEPQGKRGANIVWEWHLKDHLIQDFDESKPNYGNPADHPELLDFNVGDSVAPAISMDSLDARLAAGKGHRNQTVDSFGSDFYHFNALNYNADLDQLVFSSPGLSEIFIIDHSTTTEEAAGHQGGRWGHGGDFLYRWGNPQNYQQGDSTDQQLFGQHDVRWIPEGMPGAGHLTVFNNNVPMGPDSLSYSAVYELVPPTESEGNYVLSENRFGPESPVWSYIAPDTISFYSGFVSGAHRMANGNTFINEGARARFFEVTPDREIVWEYLNPYRGDIRETNGDPKDPMPDAYWNFRASFIPADHPAFAGKDLKPIDPQPKEFKLPPKEDKKKE